MGNPFEEESSDLYSLDTKYVLETEIADEILKIGDEGREQYRSFILRLREGEHIGFYEPIKKNKFRLFTPKQKPNSSKSKLANLKDDCSLFSRLFFPVRVGNVIYKNFSNMKIRNFPPRFYKFNAGVKSQLTPILEAGQVLPSSGPTVDSLVIDGASLVNVKQP